MRMVAFVRGSMQLVFVMAKKLVHDASHVGPVDVKRPSLPFGERNQGVALPLRILGLRGIWSNEIVEPAEHAMMNRPICGVEHSGNCRKDRVFVRAKYTAEGCVSGARCECLDSVNAAQPMLRQTCAVLHPTPSSHHSNSS
eukprot:CAMPEP_0117472598 /NCGR_PEP_ID=MMETSP0784-20121206/8332_1 /TAXON_ID=39447 /ORGANISM="" /LENGTH=140 /DNA_ID=CAMNT_0005266759 /DNA_START=103 /DNA_END=524 /DNA_ORIENTATION=-